MAETLLDQAKRIHAAHVIAGGLDGHSARDEWRNCQHPDCWAFRTSVTGLPSMAALALAAGRPAGRRTGRGTGPGLGARGGPPAGGPGVQPGAGQRASGQTRRPAGPFRAGPPGRRAGRG